MDLTTALPETWTTQPCHTRKSLYLLALSLWTIGIIGINASSDTTNHTYAWTTTTLYMCESMSSMQAQFRDYMIYSAVAVNMRYGLFELYVEKIWENEVFKLQDTSSWKGAHWSPLAEWALWHRQLRAPATDLCKRWCLQCYQTWWLLLLLGEFSTFSALPCRHARDRRDGLVTAWKLGSHWHMIYHIPARHEQSDSWPGMLARTNKDVRILERILGRKSSETCSSPPLSQHGSMPSF